MSFSNWMENYILNNYVRVGTRYVGLCRNNPGEGATGSNCQEVVNSYGYARAVATGYWSGASGGKIYNVTEVIFPPATGNWGVVTHFVICNSGSYGGGNVIVYGVLSQTRNITKYSRPRFAPGTLSITLS